MPAFTTSGSPTFNADGSCLINSTGSDLIQGPAALLTNDQGWFAIRVKMGWAAASPPTTFPKALHYSIASSGYLHGIWQGDGSFMWRIQRFNGVSGPGTLDVADSFGAGDRRTLIWRWDASNVSFSLNGAPFVSAAGGTVPVAAPISLTIGSDTGAANWLNSDVYWVCGGTGTITDAQAAFLHAQGDANPDWRSLTGTPTFLWTAQNTIYQNSATLELPTFRFDGAGDFVRSKGVGKCNAAFTVAAILNADDLPANQAVVSAYTDSLGPSWEWYMASNESFRYWDPLNTEDIAGPTLNHTDWWIVVMTRASGASTPRYHLKNLTTGAAWTHVNAAGPSSANPRDCTGPNGHIEIGSYNNGAQEIFLGDIAVVGFWDGINLSDSQCEALSANKRTSDWYNNPGGAPTFLTELTSMFPINYGTQQTLPIIVTGATPIGTVIDNGWAFDANPSTRPSYTGSRFPGPMRVAEGS